MAVLVEVFREELNLLGWTEGKNLTIDYRYAENKGAERLGQLAADLVRLKVDSIVVTGAVAALEAKKSTTTIPVVMTNAADPVASGLVTSLARPGGNVTGFTAQSVELNRKRLEILKDAIPDSPESEFFLPKESADQGEPCKLKSYGMPRWL